MSILDHIYVSQLFLKTWAFFTVVDDSSERLSKKKKTLSSPEFEGIGTRELRDLPRGVKCNVKFI